MATITKLDLRHERYDRLGCRGGPSEGGTCGKWPNRRCGPNRLPTVARRFQTRGSVSSRPIRGWIRRSSRRDHDGGVVDGVPIARRGRLRSRGSDRTGLGARADSLLCRPRRLFAARAGWRPRDRHCLGELARERDAGGAPNSRGAVHRHGIDDDRPHSHRRRLSRGSRIHRRGTAGDGGTGLRRARAQSGVRQCGSSARRRRLDAVDERRLRQYGRRVQDHRQSPRRRGPSGDNRRARQIGGLVTWALGANGRARRSRNGSCGLARACALVRRAAGARHRRRRDASPLRRSPGRGGAHRRGRDWRRTSCANSAGAWDVAIFPSATSSMPRRRCAKRRRVSRPPPRWRFSPRRPKASSRRSRQSARRSSSSTNPRPFVH